MKTPTKIMLMAGFAIGLLMLGYFQGYLHGVTGKVHDQMQSLLSEEGSYSNQMASLQAHMHHLRGGFARHNGRLEITVSERPFGMHLKRGSLVVEEVFPGFPAEKLGIHSGCTIKTIGEDVATQGDWMDIFQKRPTPFNMTFACTAAGSIGHGPVSADKNKIRTMVVKKPYGMNVQVNVVPRVIVVLPGSAAEAAGVKRGYVLTHVNDAPVDGDTWFDAWSELKLPGVLTFDTAVPLHKNNPFFNETTGEWRTNVPKPIVPEDWDEDESIDGFSDVATTVKELPFGMEVHAAPGKLPVVRSVSPGLPAEAQGVKAGDVLIKVAGHRVDSDTWFASFQHAVPPFGLNFRRPEMESSELLNPTMPVVGNLVVTVREKPFGMHVRRGSDIVQQVFPKFPAYKLGIRKGCKIRDIAGKDVSAGTWMEVFQNASVPFVLGLFCPEKVSLGKKGPEGGQGPLSAEEDNFRVKVVSRPFGMNVQTNVLPRVVEVLPGSPAEAAGVKVGFVLTAINGQIVNAKDWFDIWQKADAGSELTFDTTQPLHANNRHILSGTTPKPIPAAPVLDDMGEMILPADLENGFINFRCAVKMDPFGMEVDAATDKRPTVHRVMPGSPAEAAKVKKGDVLIAVAGLPVNTLTWFQAFQEAEPPFLLGFRRPLTPVPNNETFFESSGSGSNSPLPEGKRV